MPGIKTGNFPGEIEVNRFSITSQFRAIGVCIYLVNVRAKEGVISFPIKSLRFTYDQIRRYGGIAPKADLILKDTGHEIWKDINQSPFPITTNEVNMSVS